MKPKSTEAVRTLRMRRMKAGLCTACGEKKEPHRQNRHLCETCTGERKIYVRQMVADRKKKGRCIRCLRPAKEGFIQCEVHIDLARKYAAKHKERHANT